MEHFPTAVEESDIPQEAGPLASWIREELGDDELAAFLEEHPEGLELCANGESLLPRTMFELTEDLGSVNASEARDLVRRVEDEGMLPHLSGPRVVGNMKGEEREHYTLKRLWTAGKERLAFGEGEKEKSRYELMMIEHANSAIDELRVKYGLKPFRVPPEAVRFVEQIPSDSSFLALGDFNQYRQESRVLSEELPLQQLATTIHEMTHYKSYGAIMINRDGRNRTLESTYRTGMNIYRRDGKKRYLTSLNEAVTEETANRILMEVPDDHPVLGPLAQRHHENVRLLTERYGYELEQDRKKPYWLVPVKEQNEDGAHRLASYYATERNLMEDLFDKLYERNPALFSEKTQEEAREELFEMLQKAMFTGNILPFGRLFNETFGHGKFREFGHLATTAEQREFIEHV